MTETVYVFDSYAVLELEGLSAPIPVGQILNAMTDMVESSVLRYPDTVWREVHKYAPLSGAGVWVKAASQKAAADRCPHTFEQEVLARCPELLDETELDWQSQIQAAALALYLMASPSMDAVVIVTGDYRPRPDRMNLLDASNELQIAAIRCEDFVSTVKANLQLT